MNYFIAAISKYATFNGRAQRAEYWYFQLFSLLILFAAVYFDTYILKSKDKPILTMIFWLFFVLPELSVSVRRLHDTGRSGFWLFINALPLIGPIVLLVFTLQDSQQGTNYYGPNPKEVPTEPMYIRS